ncbi:uncharacterized protein LOC101733605 isoform X2 [Xenopus tropicalis]|uniref:Uncharacterized protein LOC101733605 isoform X2 n=1 Tax=Xenopus tropicalis TaxID=8364 RepID=A0A8J1IXC6_XENTR|nr:uncharacterized protein LOC101733605 isoform X2 [Xenopus tropicalis]
MSRPKQESPRHIVGLTSRCPAIYPKWLTDLLTTQYSDLVLAVKYLPISSGSSRQWRAEVKACSIVILYHSTKEGRIGPTGTRGTIYDKELLYLAQHLGQEKVMVVLDDMKPISEAEKEKTLKSLNSLQRYCCRLLLIPENRKITALRQKAPEIRNFLVGEHCIKRATSPPSSSRPSKNSRQAHLSGTRPIPKSGRNMAPQSDIRPSFQSREPLHQTYLRPRQTQPPSPTKVHKVGVFSRAAGSHYQWLVNQLKSAFANDVGVTFHSVPISNNYVDFTSGLANCTFAVLYHTLNSGRLSVTDVTDSLYDRELEDLSLHLGRNNVIVVLDDLTDSGPEEKKKILQNQPSINRLAWELFLISEKEKGSRGGSNSFDNVLESQILRLKLQRIVNVIKENQPRSPGYASLNDRLKQREIQRPTSRAGQADTSESPTNSKAAKNSRQTHQSESQPSYKPGKYLVHESDAASSPLPSGTPYQSPKQEPHIHGAMRKHPSSPTRVHKVGIFSRAAGSHYQWLVNQLKSAFVNDVGVTFHSVPISNKYLDFTSGLANCTFAILYHTLNSGRLNVTDVTDALYDRELEDLSLHLGRNNVIVVLDDLTDSGPEEKKKILQNQPSINRLARELFLISEKEKGSRGGSNYSASVLESQILKLKLERIVHIINDNRMAAPKGTNHRHQDSFQTEYQRQFTASQQRADHKASLSPSKSDEGKPTSNGVSSIWETKENIYYDTDSKTELGKSRNKGPTLPRSEEHVKENIGFTGAPTSSRDPQNPSRRSNEDTLGSSPSRTPASHKYDSSASYGKSPKATDHDQQRPLSSLSKKAQQRSESAKNHHKTEAPTSPHSLGQMQSSHLVDLMDNLFQQQHDMILDYYKSQLLIYEKVIKAWHGLRQQINEKDNKLTECQHIIHKQELTICKQENMIRQLMDTHPLYRQNRK